VPGRLYTNYYTNATLSQRIVYSIGGGIAHVGKDVAVDVEGKAYVFMP
jgi:hypothetical protein